MPKTSMVIWCFAQNGRYLRVKISWINLDKQQISNFSSYADFETLKNLDTK
ncbi:hypothetical protein [Nostoc sp. UHCC 0870]|uniref:hypothetical protein n=1 Tax=Nostoc sp. UHCC 0870 TaxID=2914041 RepID=UPI001EDF5033|nr:hypothetical protein [Nostoc sp. UHCC 0870]UKO99619.1 hypothetical protein L6494_07905 [Nostoc sp. UHCC 0870]